MSKYVLTRRRFVVASAASGAGVWSQCASASSNSLNEKLNIGVIGVGGRGVDNLAGIEGENVAALCDVDERFLNEAVASYPKARTFRDFRELLNADDLDAVIIATPDHTHAVAAIGALRRGLHVYCEKPLAHNLRETALMARVAKETELATQLGIQHHASAGYQRAVQLLRVSVLGEVREIHAWTSRPIWPQGIGRPKEQLAIPDSLEWDLWLGPAPQRPYHSAYHPRDWRGWWDFGTGALGDFLPHIFDPVYEGLQLTAPTRIAAKTSEVNNETAPMWSVVRFEFPKRGEQPPVTLHWHDGGKQPSPEVAGVKHLPAHGALVIGEHGKLFIPTHGKAPIVIANEKGERLDLPEPPAPPELSHWQEWIACCKTGKPTSADFAYGARLSDVALLGNIAIRAGEPIEWDAEKRRVINNDKANALLGREYREGWKLT